MVENPRSCSFLSILGYSWLRMMRRVVHLRTSLILNSCHIMRDRAQGRACLTLMTRKPKMRRMVPLFLPALPFRMPRTVIPVPKC